MNTPLDTLVRLYNLDLPAPKPVVITERPSTAHDIVAFIRARGWAYHPVDRMPWHHGRLAVRTADEALSLELGETRSEMR